MLAIETFTSKEKARYEKIDRAAKDAFVKGLLDPGLVYFGVEILPIFFGLLISPKLLL